MKLLNFAWRFALGAFMLWLAVTSESNGMATLYLTLGVMNIAFAIVDLK